MRTLKVLAALLFCALSFPAFSVKPGSGLSLREYGPRKTFKQPWRIELNYGIGRRFNSVDATADVGNYEYFSALRNGIDASVSLSYLGRIGGFGFCGGGFNFQGKKDDFNYTDSTGHTSIVKRTDNYQINFYGLSYTLRMWNQVGKSAAYLGLAVGYITYSHYGVMVKPYQIKGDTYGFNLSAGYDQRLFNHVYLGVKASVLGGNLRDPKVDGKQTYVIGRGENLMRGSLTGGLRFTF